MTTAQDIQCATTALGRAEIYDDRVTADQPRILAWAEAFCPYGFDPPTVIAAVTAHYQQANATTARPGDIIAHARRIRGDRAEREKGRDLPTGPTPPDPQLGGLPIGGADGNPVWPAYEHWGAITITCPTCGAEPEHACLNPHTDGPRKIPCVDRLTTARKAAR